MSLTESQKKAVQTLHKNILVSAGAGTGKTRVLVERILHLLKTQKAGITELLVLTFTEKAANEIKTRLSRIFQELQLERSQQDLERSAIATFHGFASRLLKEHPIEAGVDPEFRVIETEQSELLKEESLNAVLEKSFQEKDEAFELLPLYGEEPLRSGILKVLTAARHEGKTLTEFFQEASLKKKTLYAQKEQTLSREAEGLMKRLDEIDTKGWARFYQNSTWDAQTFRDFEAWSSAYKGKRKEGWKEWREILEVLAALRMDSWIAPWQEKFEKMALAFEELYGIRKKEKGFLDFDDLQMKAVGLFRGNKPECQRLRERYQKRFKFILIDEFQDTNLLQTEFVELLASGSNLFLVGDYKQSIYGFRGAEPRIFLEKEMLFKEGDAGERILLSDSFRSEPIVLDFVNGFFKALWEEDRFPFEPLNPTASRPDSSKSQTAPVEWLMTALGEEEDMSFARLREARLVAARIRELHDHEGIPYGDIAVLFQAMTSSGIYEDAFKSAEVPYFIVAGRGFYEQPEIQDMMSFLAYLETPLADIPLAATLRSPFFHITDDTLFWLSHNVKAKDKTVPFSESLKKADAIQEILPEQKERLRFFNVLCEELRNLKDRIPLSELVDMILERTGYELAVLADPSGVRRYANLRKLISMIREYETFERMPLATFLNILKRLQAQEVRESEAQIALEASTEAVRMMSVHAAKGLEFPVVIVADMGHQGSHADSKAVIAHAAEGYAMQGRDPSDLKLKKPYLFLWLDEAVKKRENEEWKRLLYVAMTRAKSRLLLSGVYKKKKDPKESFNEMSSWMDWIMALRNQLPLKVISAETMAPLTFKRKVSDYQESIREILEAVPAKVPEKTTEKSLFSIQLESRAALRMIDLPVSAYVLFHKDPQAFWRVYQIGWASGDPDAEREETDFEESGVSAADFGTAMHAFFEHVDFREPGSLLETHRFERVFSGLTKEEMEQARKIIQEFSKQPLFRKLQRAKQIKREIDFVLNGRRGLIQGKLDMLFEDNEGAWHILDYKTAVGDEDAARESGYLLQLEIYALAVTQLLKIPVRSGIVYFLKNQKAVTIPLAESMSAEKREAFYRKLEQKIEGLQKEILDFSNAKGIEYSKVSA